MPEQVGRHRPQRRPQLALGLFLAPHQKRAICENLAEHWGVNADAAKEALAAPLADTEETALGDLNAFHVDDV